MKWNKKGILPIIGIFLIVVAIVGFYFLRGSDISLSILGDQKTQLKQEYQTYWASPTDDTISNTNRDTSKFTCNGGEVRVTEDYIQAYSSASCSTKQSFNGEVVILMSGRGNTALLVGDYNYVIDCNDNGQGSECSLTKIILKPHTLDSKGDIIKNGEYVCQNCITFPLKISWAGRNDGNVQRSFEVSGIFYKTPYSCDLRGDGVNGFYEVWVQESFAQPFTVNDLSFPPTKFCKEVRPFTLRDITQGETAIYPDPIPAFNRGNIMQTPIGQIITTNYATPNVVGVLNPCAPDQANIKVAGKWVCSQVIKTSTIIREIPIREIITISGANQFITSKNFNIGSSAFIQSQKFTCQIPTDVDVVNFPQPNSDCYSSSVSYDGKTYELKDKQFVNFNNYISAQYFASGSVSNVKQNLQGTYIFNVVNPLEINVNGGITFKHNEKGTIKLTIKNNLPSNTLILKTQQKISATNQNLPEVVTDINAINGNNDFSFDIDTNNLGINEIMVQAFYPIDADAHVLLPSDKIKINLEVYGERPSIVQFINTTTVVEKPVLITVTIVVNPIKNFFVGIWELFKSIF